jgi:putative ABC transport system permease protein
VALSVALLSGAGLLIRSFQELTDVDLGYDPDNVLTFRITGSFAEPVLEPVERILAELPGLPGVEAVATSSPVPGVADDGSGFQFGALSFQSIEGGSDSETPIVAQNRVVSPSYFQTMEIPFLAGDTCRFDANDPAQEIVVNESFVRAYIPNRPPVGTLVRGTGDNAFRIGAVVGDAREFGARRAPEPTVYRCFTVAAFPPLAFLVRTTGDPMAIVNTVRRAVAGAEPTRSIYDVRTLNERVGNEYAADRLRAVLIGAFAGAALTLVCLGIYGTLSYIVSLRRREVGLRVALGALHRTIVSHFMLKAFRVVGLAAAAGLALAFLVSRGLASQLFGVSPTDPLTLAGVVAVILVVTGIGALLPSLSAARVDPMAALRQE